MSKLGLINEIKTILKMANPEMDIEKVKLSVYLDELLSNYKIEKLEDDGNADMNDDLIYMYISSREIENFSPLTLLNYRYELQRFSQFINKSLLKVRTSDVRQYLAAHSHLAISTVTSKLHMISGFYSFLVKEEELLKNPCAKINSPKLPKKVKEGLTIIELEKVRAACVDKNKNIDVRQRALIEVFYSTGCRLDEIRKLNKSDIDWVHGSVIVHGKGSKDRRVYLSEKAQHYLKLYLDARTDDCTALFATVRTPIRRLTGDGIAYQVKLIKEKSGIEKNLTPHVMRHTFAQLGLNNGMELTDLQALLGHESPETTLRYAVANEERKQHAHRRFHQQ